MTPPSGQSRTTATTEPRAQDGCPQPRLTGRVTDSGDAHWGRVLTQCRVAAITRPARRASTPRRHPPRHPGLPRHRRLHDDLAMATTTSDTGAGLRGRFWLQGAPEGEAVPGTSS